MRHPVAFLRHLSHLRAAMRAGAAGNLRLWCVGLEQGHLMRDAMPMRQRYVARCERLGREPDQALLGPIAAVLQEMQGSPGIRGR